MAVKTSIIENEERRLCSLHYETNLTFKIKLSSIKIIETKINKKHCKSLECHKFKNNAPNIITGCVRIPSPIPQNNQTR